MEVEIISVGNELILGQIVNTNVAYLADQLRQLDLVAKWQTTVTDEPAQIEAAVKLACQRADLVLVCGGLGPTADDQTLPSVARALGVDLTLATKHWAAIQADFAHRQVAMTPENIRQAYYLAGGEPLANPVGLALGSWLVSEQAAVAVLPGPPREFKAMVQASLLPKLRAHYGTTTPVQTRVLHFVGQPESLLMDEIAAALGDLPVVATSYVQPAEIQVRLRVTGKTPAVAEQLLDQAQQAIVAKEGAYYFGSGPAVTLAGQVVALLRQRGAKITAAESLTGGLFQSTLCSVSGASAVFDGGFVTYAARAKHQLIGVRQATIEQAGVVSAQTAAEMAEGARRALAVDYGVAFTGVAGPEPLEGHPAGTVFVAIAQQGAAPRAWQLRLNGRLGRQVIRQQSVALVLLALYHQLQGKN